MKKIASQETRVEKERSLCDACPNPQPTAPTNGSANEVSPTVSDDDFPKRRTRAESYPGSTFDLEYRE